jgi:hypothetical protein
VVFEYFNLVADWATGLSPSRVSALRGSMYRAAPAQSFWRTIFANRWDVCQIQKPGSPWGEIAQQKSAC